MAQEQRCDVNAESRRGTGKMTRTREQRRRGTTSLTLHPEKGKNKSGLLGDFSDLYLIYKQEIFKYLRIVNMYR
ncbi:hypothetical protein AKJ65_08025 [candidate division MSBL1 archaeon SCGC-AAA259E19]|uniref:Uncharacterized protein n=1 Tax=candidate division MSBL1 archaeon SCGC-AAA259E19 TaxID=1698264 RepID=A0A133UD36_9EURY|nr:hypothetical protein AKJ65_08025 [candidate division MSBL1 archaeon SCGC-AAA259E19]